MLRKTLESFTGPLSNSEFSEIMDLVRTDVKGNRVPFKQRVSAKDAVDIALGCFMALQRGTSCLRS